MRILLIGKTGQLGSALIKDTLALEHNVFAPSKKELDISDENTFLKSMKLYNPDVVINTAAFHNVPLCENESVKAFQINCLSVKKMAEITNDFNRIFVTFSTDYVFGGEKKEPYEELDRPNPLQIYGLSKLAGEFAALSYEKSIIIRTCGLYGNIGARSKGGNFVDNRIEESKNNKYIEISNDQTISPTYAGDLSKAVLKLIAHPLKEYGIYHLINEGYCTWYELTREIFERMNIDVELRPVDHKGKTGNMRRPLFSALRNNKARNLGIVLPHWKEGLNVYLKNKYIINNE
ncbi:MAG: dTDP-4-dehydrorhamnose reductase [Candidatus Methanoperedenaceae archaeon]|nr:dTDP-4-dehydrorhamnose reductase [Candidatus Methanoperedenaceae archaeon]